MKKGEKMIEGDKGIQRYLQEEVGIERSAASIRRYRMFGIEGERLPHRKTRTGRVLASPSELKAYFTRYMAFA